MKLDLAERYAAKIAEALRPLCQRIEIAGSIRRRRADVHDIDLVCQIAVGGQAALQARCRQSCKVVAQGMQISRYQTSAGIQLDLYFAHAAYPDALRVWPSNWGSVLLCRTGSKEHNIFIASIARQRGLRWTPGTGVCAGGGKIIASETEEEIFAALGLAYLPPERRER